VFLNGEGCTIRGNVFAGGSHGILVLKPNNTLEGNRIGVNRAGTELFTQTGEHTPIRVNGPGIFTLPNAANYLVIKNNVIGGCGGRGLEHFSHTCIIQGNHIGTDITGTVNLGNGDGVSISHQSHSNLFGGPLPEHSNVISGNELSGFGVAGANNMFQNNFIGTDITGTFAIPNNFQGIQNLG